MRLNRKAGLSGDNIRKWPILYVNRAINLNMDLDLATCREAVRTKDARFDGKFFSGVKTTGIYCRPICPARPLLKNLEFFQTALEAEAQGYRPCLRCRPEVAPGCAAWIGKSALVNRALKKIDSCFTLPYKEDEFAMLFGVSARHLRKLFKDEIGTTPKELFIVKRLNLSRKYLSETSLPIFKIIGLAGFSSTRNFNHSFKKRFKSTPLRFRKLHKISKTNIQNSIKLKLPYRPPYDWEMALQFFENHQMPGIQNVSNSVFERVYQINDKISVFRVSKFSERELELEFFGEEYGNILFLISKVRKILDLDSDFLEIAKKLNKNKSLKKMIKKRPGLRIIGNWDFFETCITTILGQLVSVAQGGRLVSQLIKSYGKKVSHPVSAESLFLFPTPEILSKASLGELGTTQKRKSTIRLIAQAFCNGTIGPEVESNELKKRLQAIPGIGPWTIEYIFLRGLGDSNSFPKTDLILKRALKKYPELMSEDCTPWKAYVAIYLWSEFWGQPSVKK